MKRLLFLAILALALAPPSAPGQGAGPQPDSPDAEASYREAAASARADLEAALEELSEIRAKIATEKPAIAREANAIAAELREARRQAEIATTRKDAVESEFEKAERDLATWREERTYLESLLADFRKTDEASRIPLPEAGRDATARPDLEASLALVDDVLARLEQAGSPEIATGEAIGEDGVLVAGTFVSAGPARWFVSGDGATSGLVVPGEDLLPRVARNTGDAPAIEAIAGGSPATLAFDPTLGTAVALTETESSLLSHVRDGGFWIYPILLLAAVALAAAIGKWIQLLGIRSFDASVVSRVLDALRGGDEAAARKAVAGLRHPSRAILERGIEWKFAAEGDSRDDLEEALYEKFLEAQPRLQRGLPLIAIASATAPLLGLLGTVTGMIETFRLINIFGTGDAKSLASGISEALVTTEFGLIVAIPSLILHALLSRKVSGIRSAMEMTSLAFLNGLAESPRADEENRGEPVEEGATA